MATRRALPLLVLILSIAIAIPPVHAQIFSDGFEDGTTDGWSGTSGSPTVVSNPVAHGDYACECDASGDYPYQILSTYTTLYTRLYVRFSALPSNAAKEVCFACLRYATGGLWYLYLATDTPNLRLDDTVGGTTNYDWSANFAVDTWYCIEVKYVKDADAGGCQVWINDGLVIDTTPGDSSGDASTTQFRAGQYLSDYTVTVWVDSVVIDSSYIGPVEEEGQDLTFINASTLLLHDSATAGLDLARTYSGLLHLWTSDTMNKEAGFQTTGTLALWAATTLGRERGFTLTNTLRLWAHSSIGKELAFTATNILHLWSSTAASFEIAAAGLNEVFTLLATLRLHAAALPTLEVRTPVEHAFNLYAAIHLHDSHALAKELSYLTTATIRLWDSAAMTTQGVAQDLTFLLTETLHLIGTAAATMQTAALVLDAASIAGLALIIALVAVALVMVRRRND